MSGDDEPTCRACGSGNVEWERCWACGGEGEFDLHDEDPVNYGEGEEFEECDVCNGDGGYLACYSCQKHAEASK